MYQEHIVINIHMQTHLIGVCGTKERSALEEDGGCIAGMSGNDTPTVSLVLADCASVMLVPVC